MEKIATQIGRVIDQLYISQFANHDKSSVELLQTLVTPDTKLYKRIRALCALGFHIPGFERQFARLIDASSLGDGSFEPYCIGYGYEQTVFRVADDMVKKVDRNSLGLSAAELEARLRLFEGTHAKLKNIFAFSPSIVLNETFEFGPAHLRGFNAVKANQHYIDSLRDFHRDVTVEDGRRMVRESTVLGDQIELFYTQSLKLIAIDNLYPDLLGAKNLSIVGNKGDYRLLLIDAHKIQDARMWSDERTIRKKNRIEKQLDHLKGMLV